MSQVSQRESVSSKMNIKGEQSSLRYKKKAKITLEATNNAKQRSMSKCSPASSVGSYLRSVMRE